MSAQTFITCPACGFVDKEFCDYPDGLRGDGDEAEWQCGMCDAICVVEMQVSYAFDTKPKPPAPATPSNEETTR